jgi:crotonobetainyl-CoA:carnitine CoA-transferase CaiB-like acyl-CoA transferase
LSSAEDFVTRARLLGLASAPLSELAEAGAPYRSVDLWGPNPDVRRGVVRVVDLSGLWAGPVVARVLAEAGSEIIKVESVDRPDGAREVPGFYRWVHAASEVTVRVDLGTADGCRQLAGLLDDAHVVIEASRPRALEQLGLGPYDRPGRPGRVWLSITGYGRTAPGRDWVAFGDDAAVAGGLVGWDDAGAPVFCADAIADPISGLAGAVAVLRALDAGGGQLIDLAMSRVAAIMAGFSGHSSAPPMRRAVVESDGAGGWLVRDGDIIEPVLDRPETLEWVISK